MKQIYISTLFVLLAQTGFAQTEKGNFLIGGGLTMGSSKTTVTYPSPTPGYDAKTFAFSMSPNVSYFIVDRLSLGLKPGYSYSDQKITEVVSTENKTRSFSVGPQIRYYYPLKNWAVFSEVSYSFGWTTNDLINPNTFPSENSVHGNLNLFTGGIGLTYFIRNNIGVEGLLYYNQNKYHYDKYSPDYDVSTFAFSIGLQLYLNKGQK